MKKAERLSFKKLTPSHKRNDSKIIQESFMQKNKSFKPKSSQKVSQGQDHNNKFKLSKYGLADKSHLKTQMNQSQYKPTYQKYPAFRKKDKLKVDKNKTNLYLNEMKKNQRNNNSKLSEGKPKNIKKLQLNEELFRIIRNSSAEKHHEGFTSNKHAHQSFRKPHESHRSVYKKTALEDYVSNSLQNLKPNKKPLPKAEEKILKKDEKNFSKKGNDTVLRERKEKVKNLLVCEDITEELKHESVVQRESKLQKNEEKQRKTRTQKDDSLDNFKIKFEKANKYDLSKEEMQTFGDRFPDGFDKVKLLGRGGFSLVWLGEHKKSKKKYAIKQIITESSHQTHIKEIWFGTYFFEFGGAPKEQFANHPGINNLVKLYYYFINKKDTWILYEKCGDSLGNMLYDLKGERVNNEKIYRIHYKALYAKIKTNQDELRKIILEVAKALQLLAENNIVHSDLKTENILVREKSEQQILEPTDDGTSIAETKLIDYGSSFVFNNLRQFSMATPEYMAPQILNFILYENELQYIHKLLEYVQKYNKPWVIDVWSLGCVVLEIISGIPLWMSLKTIVKRNSTEHIKYGLFAVKGRLFDKIIRKQIQVIQNLDHFLYEQNYSGIVIEDDLRMLLKKMLALNPEKRISPTEIIEYLTEECSSSELKEQETLNK